MRVLTSLAAILALSLPAAAATYEIYPANKMSSDGSYRPVIDVLRDGRRIAEFRSDRNEIPAHSVLDPRAAIAFVVAQYGLDPARDSVTYCTYGTPGMACRVVYGIPTGGPVVVTWP